MINPKGTLEEMDNPVEEIKVLLAWLKEHGEPINEDKDERDFEG